LMEVGAFVPLAGRLPDLSHFTAFEFWLLRINDTLPRTGWRINDVHHYRLTPITAEHEAWLSHKLNAVAA
jgi:hypothetical protein